MCLTSVCALLYICSSNSAGRGYTDQVEGDVCVEEEQDEIVEDPAPNQIHIPPTSNTGVQRQSSDSESYSVRDVTKDTSEERPQRKHESR